MSVIIPSITEFFGPLTGPYNNIVGTDDAETISGTDADDYIEGLDSNSTTGEFSVLDGGLGNDFIEGGAGLDILIGGEGDDLLIDLGDNGELYGGSGDDYMIASDGGYNLLVGGEGTDVLVGNAGEDYLFGGDGGDMISAGELADFVYGGNGNDQIDGGEGDDVIHGDAGDDVIFGGSGDDFITTSLGNDVVEGGAGDDIILSISDSGQPIPAQDEDYNGANQNGPIEASNDILNGGSGADDFIFELQLNARNEVADRNQDGNTGILDWQAIAGENTNPHDHWVQGIGTDVIGDFNAAEGDTIQITGYSVAVAVELYDSTDDGIVDSTRLTLFSDQGVLGVANGAHEGDFLGQIYVEGAQLTAADITVENDVFHGAFETYDDFLG